METEFLYLYQFTSELLIDWRTQHSETYRFIGKINIEQAINLLMIWGFESEFHFINGEIYLFVRWQTLLVISFAKIFLCANERK